MIIGSGAEATIERDDDTVRKVRPVKGYRHPDLDRKLRQFRTRREAKVLERLAGVAPSLIGADDEGMVVTMSYIDGPQLRDVLAATNAQEYGRLLGEGVRAMHDAGVVHGDLTTSNVLVVADALRFIDFGLSFFSGKVEDLAVDLHLLKHALHAKHPALDVWESVRQGYGEAPEVWERLDEVELRGRYKKKGS